TVGIIREKTKKLYEPIYQKKKKFFTFVGFNTTYVLFKFQQKKKGEQNILGMKIGWMKFRPCIRFLNSSLFSRAAMRTRKASVGLSSGKRYMSTKNDPDVCSQCILHPLHLRTHIEFTIPPNYNWKESTSANYGTSNDTTDKGDPYYDSKKKLDYTYHAYYTQERQNRVHNVIINHYMNLTKNASISNQKGRKLKDDKWILFTAGPMGAGKTHTVRWLHHQQKVFPLDAFVHVSADRIKQFLPEYTHYLKYDPKHVGM
ncbi:hypothetical protein RFI_19901, partial [Reticulomyxa filosa]